MKMKAIAICAMVALLIAGKALAEDQHKGHQHSEKATTYSCPMHKEVKADKAGKCPKCGMVMTGISGEGKKYRCPMHKDVTADKEGTCSKCKMKLEFVEAKESGGGKY